MFYAEFGAEPRLTTQCVRLYTSSCALAAGLTLALTWVGNLLILDTVWTLRTMALLFVALNSGSWILGWFTGANQPLSKWARDSKLDKKLWAFIRAVLIFISGFVLIYVGFIILGVPLSSSMSETLHFVLLVNVVVVLPGCFLLGSNTKNWIRVLFGHGPQTNWEQTWLNTLFGCLAGIWFGAFCIPLDWDRPWQVWPVSSCYGGLAGFGFAHMYNLYALRQKSARRKNF